MGSKLLPLPPAPEPEPPPNAENVSLSFFIASSISGGP